MPWSRGSGRADSAFILPVHSGGTGTSAPGGRNISVCLGKGKIKKKRKRIYKTVSGCASVGVRRLKCGIFSGKFSAGSGKGNADHVPGAGPDLKGMELYDPADEDEYWSRADPGGVFRTDRSGGCQKFCYGHCDCKKERGKYGKSDPADNSQIQEKEELNQEIETVISAKKMEFLVMAVIPFGMIAYMMLSFPEFMEVLYQGVPGRAVMTGCLVLYLAAFGTGFRMIQIEV